MDFYFDDFETRVFTSDFLRKRKGCCKSSCLHCPYGHTLKTIGLEKRSYNDEEKLIIAALRENNYNLEENFVNSLLTDALNEKKKEIDIDELIRQGIELIFLKQRYCGFWVPSSKKIFLKTHFRFQGIQEKLGEEAS